MNEFSSVIIGVVRTEKAVKSASFERSLTFTINMNSGKNDVREAIENMFKVKVEQVRTYINPKGKKVAVVKFSPETDVESIASSLKIA